MKNLQLGFFYIHALTSRYDEARTLMNEIKESSRNEYGANTFKAFLAAYLNELDEAIDYLEKACEERDPVLLMLKYEWWVPGSLRADPRFQNLLERIGFPE